MSEMKKIKLLFVCLGNICRSPTAEGVMNGLVKKRKLEHLIECDSAGTSGWHVGELADSRMRLHASERGHQLTSRSRQVSYEDLQEFDYIFAMDRSNYRDLVSLDRNGKFETKIKLMTDYCTKFDFKEVPDPYYGGDKGFELVIDILEDACEGALDKILEEHKD